MTGYLQIAALKISVLYKAVKAVKPPALFPEITIQEESINCS